MANTKFDSRYGSNGDPTLAWMPFCARIAPDPLLPGSCGTSYCFWATDSALSNSPAVPVATTSTLSA